MIYLDHNATTPPAPEVLDAMLPFLTDWWGNPSSAHSFGKRAADAVDHAREQVAGLINATPEEIVFTSCGTESINTALTSALAAAPERRHIVTTAVEHSATLKHCRTLEDHGYAVTYLPVDAGGLLNLQQLAESLRPDTAVVSTLWANNETGVLFPLPAIGTLCQERGVRLHVDAVQVPGKLPINLEALGIDYLSASGHKFRAPKGVGFLFVRSGCRVEPRLIGGGQEGGRRGGTSNVAGIVALGKAAELGVETLPLMHGPVRELRNRLESVVLEKIRGTRRNGAERHRLPNTANLGFEGVEGEALLLALDREGIAVSTGSACSAGAVAPSPVLTAMGLSPQSARGSLRFSLGVTTTEAEVEVLLEKLPRLVAVLRAQAQFG